MRTRFVVRVDRIGAEEQETAVVADAAFLEELAERLGLPAVHALTANFVLRKERGRRLLAHCRMQARLEQNDIGSMEPFQVEIDETATLRLVPHAELTNALNPDDPVDEVGYEGNEIDLQEVLAEQLALTLDPYPRAPDAAALN